MQIIEEGALVTYKHVVPFCFRKGNNTIIVLHANKIEDFHTHINKQNSCIQFTKDVEKNGTLPFLHWLAKHDNQKLRTTVHRKPTQSSYSPASHKANTIRTIGRRAQIICD